MDPGKTYHSTIKKLKIIIIVLKKEEKRKLKLATKVSIIRRGNSGAHFSTKKLCK